MKHLIAAALSIFFLSGSHATSADKYNPDPATWEVVQRPDDSDAERSRSFFYDSNSSPYDWVVRSVDGKVVAQLWTEDIPPEETPEPKFDTTMQIERFKSPPHRILKVSDGWLVAYNRGEFGGAVYWFSEDGKTRTKLSHHQINQFLVEGERIFAVQGLAHLGMSEGSMIEIRKADGAWKVEEFLPLPGSAAAIARVGAGDYLIVTSDSLLRVNLEREVLMLIPVGNWGGLYPNSIVVAGEDIYIGMRQFVGRCKLGRSVQKLDLLVPDAKWLSKKSN